MRFMKLNSGVAAKCSFGNHRTEACNMPADGQRIAPVHLLYRLDFSALPTICGRFQAAFVRVKAVPESHSCRGRRAT
jgi:hypothetical protein